MKGSANLFSIELNKTAQRTLTYRAKSLALVGLHAAVLKSAIHPFRHISASFVNTNFVHFLGIGRCGNFSAFSGQKVLPFVSEMAQCGDVLFPRFGVGTIIVFVLVVVVILVCQSCKTMSELMHHYGFELAVV